MASAVCCRVKPLFEDLGAPRAVDAAWRLDRSRFHPCARLWREPSCRGHVSLRTKYWTKTAHLAWLGPGFPYWAMPPGDTWLASMHEYRDRAMREASNPCSFIVPGNL